MRGEDPGKIPGKHRSGLLKKLNFFDNKLFLRFLNNKLYLGITGFVLLVVIWWLVYGFVILPGISAQDRSTADQGRIEAVNDDEIVQQAEVLPQQIRQDDSEERSWSPFSSTSDPFGGPMKLTGIVTGGRGGGMAIVESSGTSYIVAEGDYVDDLWSVHRISLEQVVLRAHDQEVTLFFDKSPETRSLGTVNDEDDPEEDE